MPWRCSSLSITTLGPATLTGAINDCHTSLRGPDGVAVPTGCFENYGAPVFDATSTFSCISNAPICCQSTSSCPPAAAATPPPELIPPPSNFGFESGVLEPWAETRSPATPNNIAASISTDMSHTGMHSLKIEYNNLVNNEVLAFSHRVRYEPGVPHSFSFWYYLPPGSSFSGYFSIRAAYPGYGFEISVGGDGIQFGKWLREGWQMTPPTSFGTITITYYTVKSSAGHVVYIDDVALVKL
ncbi:hypothetical protein QBC34DRAFT_374912 [Podospora aff. communis PSN243]|uniref:MAM domain-containing protein n=1 Tax=Podospora aff. communis PSN243 TaxID=3040156 RepID=A0AAV9H4F9_9PEZI|nr:hypothetical protein QBC34DRAFT_374912 [Podospora aff. communis PSN243]